MTTEVLEQSAQVAGTDIVVAVTQNPGIVLLDSKKFDAFYDRMKAETDKLVPDTSTAKGRDEIRSLAARVVRSATAIDKARLALTKQWRDQTKLANDAGKVIEERMYGLADEVRRPLTEWEEAEKARIAECNEIIAKLTQAGVVTMEDTAATVRARGLSTWTTELDPERFGDLHEQAVSAKDHAVSILKTALARLVQEEKDRAELDQLRAEAAARAEADRIAAEQAEAARLEAERIESERLAAERAEQERVAAEEREKEHQRVAAEQEAARIEQARKDAAEAAQREAEHRAREEQAERDRQHEAEMQAERDKVAEAERARQDEIDRAAATEAARVAEQERLAKEQAKREANQKHRTAVKTAAKKAIMACGASEEVAQKVVLAIIAGEVPAVTLEF